MKVTESRENLLGNGESGMGSTTSVEAPPEISLTQMEKRFLLCAERGDVATVRRLLAEYKDKPSELNINCVDPLNRSALIAAIENENIDLIMLLLEFNIHVQDSLLHAIKEEYVEAVEVLLEWEERNHAPGTPYSWESVDRNQSTFTPDITPLILAAHMNNYEILKILLDRGASLPMPHDVRCGCDECVLSSETDSLRHSQARINAYRALSSPSLIALSSRDPLLTAFELSWELRRLSRMENEFREEYNEMRKQVMEFATSLLDHVRTSFELEIMLNHNPDGETWEPGERQTLERLKLAIKYKQKQFVAHPNVQQLLAAIWYEGLPGFRRKTMVGQLVEVGKLGAMFPVYSSVYMLAPTSKMGQFMKKPFVKFICHSSSYAFFLMLLSLASQRVEYLIFEWFGTPWMKAILEDWLRRERGSLPGPVEFGIIIYIISLIWNEMRSLWSDGLLEYISDLWNIVDFITNVFYLIWIFLRAVSWFVVQREFRQGKNPWYPREQWDPFDPMLLSEGAFAAGMIFSYLKLVHIFSINPHLGPLQISLGRMIVDIIKFFFIYSLVLFAFGCGMNQLLWYYADLEKNKCYHLPDGLADFDNEEKACTIWRRFANLFETSQSLFWASFGLVDLVSFELKGIKSFTRFWALLMFGSYSVINIIVLLNMLIAMMSNSYQLISEHSDKEWKFARSRLWMSYFEEGDTVPAPFNLIPTTKNMLSVMGCRKEQKRGSVMKKSQQKAVERHETVMHLLVRRYVTAETRKRDEFGITEDDVMEIRQDISTLRFELIDILRNNGMRTPNVAKDDHQVGGKKNRVMERRLQKGFCIGFVEGVVQEAISGGKEPKDVFSKIAKAIGRRASGGSKKKDWNAMVRKQSVVKDPIGSTNEASVRRARQSIRRHIISNENQALQSMDPQKLIQYNPNLSPLSPAARVAYAKFKMRKIKQEYDEDKQLDDGGSLTAKQKTATLSKQNWVKAAAAASRPRPTAGQKLDTATTSSEKPGGLKPPPSTPTPTASPQSSPKPSPAPSPEPTLSPKPSPAVKSSTLQVDSQHSESPENVKKDFRSRTPIQEEPEAEEAAAATLSPKKDDAKSPKKVDIKSPQKEDAKTPKKAEAETSKQKDEESSPKKPKPSPSPEPPQERRAPHKPGGKSKLTGQEHADTEWKFARSRLWMSYFEDGDTLPSPFNIFPTIKNISKCIGCKKGKVQSNTLAKKYRDKAALRHETVMHLLVKRYVTAETRRRDEFSVTGDDIMEIRRDISSMRYELIDILSNNGMRTPRITKEEVQVPGKKNKIMERRLQKDFYIGFIEGLVNELISTSKEPRDLFSKIARAIGRRNSEKKDWNALVQCSTKTRDPIGTASSVKSRQSLRKHIIENRHTALLTMDTEKLVQYNPELSNVSHATRIAYAKFKMPKIRQEYMEKANDEKENEETNVNENNTRSPKSNIPHTQGNQIVTSALINSETTRIKKANMCSNSSSTRVTNVTSSPKAETGTKSDSANVDTVESSADKSESDCNTKDKSHEPKCENRSNNTNELTQTKQQNTNDSACLSSRTPSESGKSKLTGKVVKGWL